MMRALHVVSAMLSMLAISPRASAALSPEAANASATDITHGSPDADDAAVVALVSFGGVTCSGTLVSSSVVLTAAHCIAGLRADQIAVVVVDGEHHDTLGVADVTPHPAFDFAGRADVGLVRLSSRARAQSLALLDADAIAALTGARVRIAGFGGASHDDTSAPMRRAGDSIVTSVDGELLSLAAAPALPCGGDSGGPALVLVNGALRVAGVVSRGDASCSVVSRATRVDWHARFVADYAAEGTMADGARCFADSSCASAGARCVVPDDAPGVGYCAPSCAIDRDCPTDMRCGATKGTGRSCALASPSPGAFGARCTDAYDCATHDCALDPSTRARACTRPCANDDGACGDGFACMDDVERPGTRVCLPRASADASASGLATAASSDSGCSISRTHDASFSPRASTALLAFPAAVIVRRRRRARGTRAAS